MNTILNLFSLLGSLAMFLYGMKIMSEGLEKFAGDRLRTVLASMTKNRVMGVLTGIFVTALIQSSSATTVMIVSFVNAGLMNLTQAIGVIMGANIGTTVTAWVISAIGFKINIAAFAITLMLFDMNIPGFGFEQAAALAMGQNIGTTITAFMASLTANTQARRAALAHMFFNVFGVVIILPFFYPACDGVSWFVTHVMGADNNPLFKLSAFHTAFNIFNTLLLIWFVKQIEELVCKILPMKEQDEEYRLKYISAGLLSTAELSILEAQKEINSFAERCQRMYGFTKTLLDTDNEKDFMNLFSRIEKYEAITDRMEVEIANYLNQVSEGRLSSESKMEIQMMLRQISELESIGDSCFNIGRSLNRKREHGEESFTPQQHEHIVMMMSLVDQAFDEMVLKVEHPAQRKNINKSYNIEHEINNFRNQLKNQNVRDVENGKYSYQLGVYYVDLIAECEKVGDYILNVVEACLDTKGGSAHKDEE